VLCKTALFPASSLGRQCLECSYFFSILKNVLSFELSSGAFSGCAFNGVLGREVATELLMEGAGEPCAAAAEDEEDIAGYLEELWTGSHTVYDPLAELARLPFLFLGHRWWMRSAELYKRCCR